MTKDYSRPPQQWSVTVWQAGCEDETLIKVALGACQKSFSFLNKGYAKHMMEPSGNQQKHPSKLAEVAVSAQSSVSPFSDVFLTF